MRSFWLISASLSVLARPSTAFAAVSTNETAILQIEQDMAAAQNADAVTAMWNKDAVWYDIAPGEVDGLAAIRQDIAGQFAKFADFHQTILRIKIKADDHIGFAFSTQHFVSNRVADGAKIDVVFRETDCFVKEQGKWTLLHQQLSYPVDASGKAVFDSK